MTADRNKVTFGWVIRPAATEFSKEILADSNRAGEALMEANEKYIEALPPSFTSLWMEDHFQWNQTATLEAITTLSYLAGRHERFDLGHIVLGQSYRNPALTAKMAANMQLLTHGRFILGIGAGWKEDEYRAYGYPFPSAGQRIAELEDAVQIIRAMWAQSPATYHGQYLSIENAESSPKPKPPIPLLIAGGGEQKTLKVVARYADWWNHNICTVEEFAHKKDVLYKWCDEIGRDPNEIYLTYYAMYDPRENRPQRENEPHIIFGSTQQTTEEFQRFVDLGVRHFQVRLMDFPSTDGLRKLTEEIIPQLKV